jgi:ACS family hexuronate transporter-like MFS transporter
VLSITWWSVAAMAHGLVSSTLGFGVARFFLGAGEAGNFPAAVKTVAEWFPKRERALAVGIFNCGSNIGAVITPLAVPWITLRFGWRAAFLATGAVGLLWVAAWLLLYRAPGANAKPEDEDEASAVRVPWVKLLAYRETWGLIIARFLTDPVWWFYLYWLPKFLQQRHGITLAQIGLPLVVVYLAADGGSIFGGWLSSTLIRRGMSVGRARKIAILVSALMVVPVAFAPRLESLWAVIVVLGFAAAGHQGWAANMFALISDLFPTSAISSATGISGFGGSVGGMLIATGVGLILQYTGSYVPMFLFAASSYLLVLALIHWLIPVVRTVDAK